MLNRRSTKLAALLAALAVLALATSANALKLRAGNIVVVAEGGFTPTQIPRHENVPVRLHGSVKISTVDGALPPILKTVDIEFDKNGEVDTDGLPVCPRGRVEATTVEQARAACGGAIVGEGRGSAIVKFPEQAPIPVSSPITIFNGPRKHGNPTVLAHAYLKQPVVSTFVVPIEIERIHKGVYGYRTEVEIPKIAGGAGIPISGSLRVGKQWTYKGEKHSYITGSCPTGRALTRIRAGFSDDTTLFGVLLNPCQPLE